MKADTQETVGAFAERHGITMTAKLLGIGPDYAGDSSMDDPRATHWLVTLTYAGRKLSTPYHMGSAFWRWKRSGKWGEAGERVNEYAPVLRAGRGLSLWGEEVIRDRSEPIPPELADVLNSLRLDAEGIENARNFEEWAGEYGYDTDSRKAEETYRDCQKMAGKLARFLGVAYRELFTTEPL